MPKLPLAVDVLRWTLGLRRLFRMQPPVSFEHTGPSPAGCPIRDTLNRLSPLKQGIAREGLTSGKGGTDRSEEHTSELQSLMRISYAVFCLKKKKHQKKTKTDH